MNHNLFILNYRSEQYWASCINLEDVEALPKSRTKERLINAFKYNLFNLDSEIRKAIRDYLADNVNNAILSSESEQDKKIIALKALSETNEADFYELKNIMHGPELIPCSHKDLLIIHLTSKLHKLNYMTFDECFERRSPVRTTKVKGVFCSIDLTKG